MFSLLGRTVTEGGLWYLLEGELLKNLAESYQLLR